METKSHPQRQSQQCSNSKNEKEKSAIARFRACSTSYFQTIMLQVGMSQSQCEVNCPMFLNFVHMVISSLFQALQNMKIKLCREISEEEQACLNSLNSKGDFDEDPQLQMALKSFNEDLPKFLKTLMLDAGYEVSDVEENDDLVISFLSKVLMSEADALYQRRSDSSKNNGKKKRSVDERSGEESPVLPLGDVNLSDCPAKLVSETKRHCVYCVSTPHGLRALKTIKTDNPTMEDVQNLENELKIGSQMTYHANRKSCVNTTYQNKRALLLEWAQGKPLSTARRLAIPNFLTVAREIASCLLAMHSNKICHLNLTCDHIILNPESNSIKIIGFGKSTSFCSKRSHNPKLLERDLRHVSPEQTGRVNRDVDFRSDFYSLGIIFYRLLVGRHPFKNESPLKMIKMHVLHQVQPVHKIDPNIPLPLSNMISKLIEKNVDLRYKSAKGIIHDIDLIISDYKAGIEIGIAKHDVSETLLIPQKLYGRDIEYSKLVATYDRIVSSTSCEIVIIKGKSGTGKTSLVMEFYKHVIRNGSFICGKYDYYKSKPYAALIEAIKMLCDTILLEDELTIAKYRSTIQDVIGDEGKLLTNVIDNLHLIIGEQPDISESYGREVINRFNYVLIKFLRVIAKINNPLVMVLEDLQWIDLASLDLISSLVDSSMKNLMLIGTYRNNEVGDEHKLLKFLNAVEKKNISLTEIVVDNMDHECMNEFISDALRVPPLYSYPLTSLIYKKTEGNPFFVKQMLNDLNEQKIITFIPESNKWHWNDCIDKDNDIAENVLDLLRKKIRSLDMHAQHALTIASCLGSPFSLSTLRLIINSNKTVGVVLASGMIVQNKDCDTCCFVHDQVQHAANSLLPENPKPMFLYVARKLWALLSTQDLKENICVIVNLFDNAKNLINENERLDVAELFLLAGKKSMACTAPKEALKYFTSGIELLDGDSWKTRYKLSLNIHCNAAESAYCIMNYSKMKELIEEILKNSTDILDFVTPYLLLIRMYGDKRRDESVITSASKILHKLGESIDLNSSISASEILQTKKLVGESAESVLELREMGDRKMLSVMEIFNCIADIPYVLREVIAPLSMKMVQLTLKHGVSKYSCLGFCLFAVVLRGIGDKSSYDFGKLSLKLLERSNAKEMIPKVNLTFFASISPFFAPLHSSLDQLCKATSVSLEIGSHYYSSAVVARYFIFSFFCGESLSKMIDEMGEFEDVLSIKIKVHGSVYQAILNLHCSEIEDPAKLIGEKFDYNYCFAKEGAKIEIFVTSLISCVIAFVFYDYGTALKLLDICKLLKEYVGRSFIEVFLYFYNGLAISSIARNEDRKEKNLQLVKDNISHMKKFAPDAPENCLNKVTLLEAELAVMQQKEAQAKSHFQMAISLSKKHRYLNEEALACERAAMFYLDLEMQEDATKLLLQSYNCYKVWGANSKMGHLILNYPFLEAALKSSPNAPNNASLNLKVNADSMESVSLLTDDTSVASISTGREKKRVRFSIKK